MRFCPEDIHVDYGFHLGEFFSLVSPRRITQIDILGVISNGVHTTVTRKKDGALVMKLLRDHRHLPDAKDIAGTHK